MGKHAKTEAGTRAKRTLIQGLFIAVLMGASSAVLVVMENWTNNDVYSTGAWIVLGGTVIQAVLTSAASYFQKWYEERKLNESDDV